MKKLLASLVLLCSAFAYANAQEPEVVAPSDLTKKASAIKKVAPTGISAGVSAMVVVEIVVSKEGKVIDAKIKKSNNPDCEPACIEAVRAWEFSPGEKGGAPVATRLLIPFRFGESN